MLAIASIDLKSLSEASLAPAIQEVSFIALMQRINAFELFHRDPAIQRAIWEIEGYAATRKAIENLSFHLAVPLVSSRGLDISSSVFSIKSSGVFKSLYSLSTDLEDTYFELWSQAYQILKEFFARYDSFLQYQIASCYANMKLQIQEELCKAAEERSYLARERQLSSTFRLERYIESLQRKISLFTSEFETYGIEVAPFLVCIDEVKEGAFEEFIGIRRGVFLQPEALASYRHLYRAHIPLDISMELSCPASYWKALETWHLSLRLALNMESLLKALDYQSKERVASLYEQESLAKERGYKASVKVLEKALESFQHAIEKKKETLLALQRAYEAGLISRSELLEGYLPFLDLCEEFYETKLSFQSLKINTFLPLLTGQALVYFLSQPC